MLLAVVGAALALPSCGEDTGPLLPPRFGFNDNSVRAGEAKPEQSAALTRRVGGRISRLTLDWRQAEPRPGRYELREYDRIYRALRRRGVRPLWIPMFAPRWAWEPGVRCAGDCRYPPAEEADGAWRRLLATLARRYPRSAGIEVWNEPNLGLFWDPRPDPRRYSELLRSAHRAVKRVAPEMPVVSGGLANVETDDAGNLSIGDFAQAMYQGGAARHTDALGLHVSPSRVNGLDEDAIEALQEARDEAGDGAKPIWVTEVGASTKGPPGPALYNEAGQAEALVESFRRLSEEVDVTVVLVHTLVERRVPGVAGGFGVVRRDFSPKPAYCALGRELRASFRCPRGPVVRR